MAHPSDMTEAERAAMVASDPDAFDEMEPEPKAAEAKAEEPAPEEPAPAKAEEPEINQRAFNGVLADLRDTRKELSAAQKALQELQEKVTPPEPARDFAGEKKALRDKFESGDIEDEDYREQREAVVIAEAEARAVARYETAQAEERKRQAAVAAQNQAKSWNDKIGSWIEANKDFMKNPLRAGAVATLIKQIGADTSLSDDDLLAQVEEAAFDAFSWKTSDEPVKPNPHAARNAADAAATSRAASAPPSLTAAVGTGNRNKASKVDLDNVKPGSFSKMSKADQEALLGEGALD